MRLYLFRISGLVKFYVKSKIFLSLSTNFLYSSDVIVAKLDIYINKLYKT